MVVKRLIFYAISQIIIVGDEMNRKVNLDKLAEEKYIINKPEELKYPEVTVINANIMDNEYFYRHQEMFRTDLDETPL